MASRIPTLALLTLLAACATTAPQTDSSTDANAPTYLQGLSSKYSIRLDEIDSQGSQARAKQLPNGLAAGDETITLCAALFRKGNVFGLDLVVDNHDLKPFDLYRENISIRDNTGRDLKHGEDFAGAQSVGLRGLSSSRLAQGLIPGTRQSTTRTPDPQTIPEITSIRGMKNITPPVETTNRPTLQLASDVEVEMLNPDLPDILQVDPGEGRVYWSYWQGSDVDFPVYVTVSVNGRRLLFKFDSPE